MKLRVSTRAALAILVVVCLTLLVVGIGNLGGGGAELQELKSLARTSVAKAGELSFSSSGIVLSFRGGTGSSPLKFNGTDGNGTLVFGEISREAQESAGKSFVSANEGLFMSSFLPRASPYPGAVTQEIACPKESWPETLFSDDYRTVFSARAGERLNYGVCLNEDWKYNSTYLIAYCKNTSVEIRMNFFSERAVNKEALTFGAGGIC